MSVRCLVYTRASHRPLYPPTIPADDRNETVQRTPPRPTVARARGRYSQQARKERSLVYRQHAA